MNTRNVLLTDLTAGTDVLLVDARGCHALHRVTNDDRWTVDEGFRLAGQCWDTVRFHVTTDFDRRGKLVLRCEVPAIGRVDSPWHPTFLPKGWASPSSLALALGNTRRAS